MIDYAPPTHRMSVTRRLLSVALAPFILATLAGTLCDLSAGPSLGIFIGGLWMISLLAPPLVAAESRSLNRIIVLAALLVPLCIAWLIAGIPAKVHFTEWLGASLVLIGYAIALTGLSTALKLVRIPPILSAALSVIAGLTWLTWPIWASRTWNGGDSEASVARIIVCHPGFVINGQVTRALGNWTEQSLAYHLTDLSQSVNFALPQSIWPCVLLHGLIGVALLILAAWLENRPPNLAAAIASNTPPSSAPITD